MLGNLSISSSTHTAVELYLNVKQQYYDPKLDDTDYYQ